MNSLKTSMIFWPSEEVEKSLTVTAHFRGKKIAVNMTG
ncbi:hypothetical protein X474_24355 [Dethiosulfatarculus sandiegensis]|uniref:Uncharacterized protein n=1 Tax=Dethiosulfatarculus sandiegensis TaxID=1429043 RepID=A0A0D2J798_9BACT|nr:hypothetical protein X474_24355 [Dethiosulfatarculus sandiegensis]